MLRRPFLLGMDLINFIRSDYDSISDDACFYYQTLLSAFEEALKSESVYKLCHFKTLMKKKEDKLKEEFVYHYEESVQDYFVQGNYLFEREVL